MINWLKSLVGIRDIQNLAGLSENSVKLLKKDLVRLDKKAAGISDRLLHYLLDGDGEEVLHELLSISEAGSILDLKCNTDMYSHLSFLNQKPPLFFPELNPLPLPNTRGKWKGFHPL